VEAKQSNGGMKRDTTPKKLEEMQRTESATTPASPFQQTDRFEKKKTSEFYGREIMDAKPF